MVRIGQIYAGYRFHKLSDLDDQFEFTQFWHSLPKFGIDDVIVEVKIPKHLEKMRLISIHLANFLEKETISKRIWLENGKSIMLLSYDQDYP